MVSRYDNGMSAATAPAVNAIIDWNGIDHVLLDMDGTILDLAFDNYFWSELVPQRYAQLHGLSVEAAIERLTPRFESARGRLDWYCLDYWSRLTGLDIAALKHEIRARIAPLPGSAEFIRAVRDSGRQLWLVTNAHRHSWQLKMAQTGFEPHFHRILSSHDFGAPKEDPRFWPALRAQHLFDPARAIFVDDSLPVLREALNHGFAHVVAIRHPDSQAPKRAMPDFTAVDRLVELLPLA